MKESAFGLLKMVFPVIDALTALMVYPAALLMKQLRVIGIEKFPCCKKVLLRVGVFPILDHYYEPLFDAARLDSGAGKKRELKGIDWNLTEQLRLLQSFEFGGELHDVPTSKQDETTFHINNDSFGSGDAEYLYNLIRLKKPKRIFEIGSGNSTLIAAKAVKKNREKESGYHCKHVCIEPYEMPWLEKIGVSVLRQKVECIPKEFFLELAVDDLLFIDSSHIIRPQGDVLYEYLELLPALNSGVIVHIHDIFSPNDYSNLCQGLGRFWNEQYLLEAFLMSNSEWEILGSLNYLQHNHYQELKENCLFLTPEREPGSFYLRKK